MHDLHARALELFDDYVDLPIAERTRRLRILSIRDPDLHSALCTLLNADRSVPDEAWLPPPPHLLLQTPQPVGADEEEAAADVDRTGHRLGPWRIDKLLARGGMGAIYVAERDDGHYQQRVALKCIRLELATPRLVAAFRRERDALARLDHPGIVNLLDGGVDDEGCPWFAMPLVNGAPIDIWSDARRADTRQRVSLLLQACRALTHAHAQGVTHGDIKPSNVLVGDDGRVHLVDFGLASIQDQAGERVGVTTDYAALELLLHGSRAAATDIYALGVLMYRLLSGQWPTERHALRSLVPPPHAEAASMRTLLAQASIETALARGEGSVAALTSRIGEDLSAIARKAVAHRPEARYPSVSALSEDLQHWLDHRPVDANPLPQAARVRRWIRRQPLQAGMVATLALTLAGAITIAHLGQRRQAQEAQASRGVERLFAQTLGSATLSGLGATPFSSKNLLLRTERELRALPLREHPALLASGLAALARSYAVMGEAKQVERLTAEALSTANGAGEPESDIIALRMSILTLQGRPAEAEALARKALQRAADRSRSERRQRLALLTELARAQWDLGRPPQALATLNRALLESQAVADNERTAELLIVRSTYYYRMMRNAEAEGDARRALALARPTNPVLADDARERLVNALKFRQGSETLQLAQELLAGRRRTLGEHHPQTGWARIRLSTIVMPEAAGPLARQGLADIEAAYGREHPEYAAAQAAAAWTLGLSTREEIAMLRHALGIMDRTIGPRSERTLNGRGVLGALLLELTRDEREPGDLELGMALLRRNIDDLTALGLPASMRQLQLANGIVARAGKERLPEAGELLQQCLRYARERHAASDGYPMMARMAHGKWQYRSGQRDLADRDFAQWIEFNRSFIEAARLGSDTNDHIRALTLTESMLYRALYAYESCDRPRAEAQLQSVIRFYERTLGPDGKLLLVARQLHDNLRRTGKMTFEADSRLIAPAELVSLNERAAACPSRKR